MEVYDKSHKRSGEDATYFPDMHTHDMTHNTTCTQLLWEKKTVSYLVIEIHIYDELWPYVWRPYNTKILRQLCLFQHCKT